jgi:hypothetical protein
MMLILLAFSENTPIIPSSIFSIMEKRRGYFRGDILQPSAITG